MRPPQRPELDKRSFAPEVIKHHERLTPFIEGTISSFANLAGLELVTRTPIRAVVPDDWRPIPYAPNWANLGTVQAFNYRKLDDGTVKVRGSFRYTGPGTPPAGTLVSPLTPELVTAMRESFVVLAEAPATAGALSVSGTGLRYESGPIAAISVSGLEWGAASRMPLPWEGAWPISVASARPPTLVMVRAARLSADGREAGTFQLLAAEWSADTVRGTGFSIARVPGLLAGSTYNLYVYAALQ